MTQGSGASGALAGDKPPHYVTDGDPPESRGSGRTGMPEPSLGRVMWDAWKAYSHRAGGYQTIVLLSLVYFLVLGPSTLIARLTGTRLLDLDHRKPRGSCWIERPASEKTVASLERQF